MKEGLMREPTFLILTSLATTAQHGYGIMLDVERISEGRVRLRAGTLYSALDRLRSDGLIEADREEVVDARLRRYYRITDEGKRQLEAEVTRMRANAAVAARRLGGRFRMSEANALERRYRRLLAVYPPAHRLVHGEEMVGVLLASAPSRQRWPGIADVADLIAGAVRIRFRAQRGRPTGTDWADAFALASVIAPILLLADGLATTDLLGVAIRSATGPPENPFWVGYWWIWPITFGPAVLTLFALAGWRRSTAVTALLTTAGAAVGYLTGSLTYLASPGLALKTYLGLLAAAGAMLSPGPRRGMEILRWWGAAVICAVALVLAELTKGPEFNIPVMHGNNPVLLIGASLVLAVAGCLTSRTGRCLLVLLAIPAVPYASYLLERMSDYPAWWPAMQAAWVLLPSVLVVVVVIALARARGATRGQAPPQG